MRAMIPVLLKLETAFKIKLIRFMEVPSILILEISSLNLKAPKLIYNLINNLISSVKNEFANFDSRTLITP